MISDVGDMDAVAQVCQLEVFAVQGKLDSGSCDAADEEVEDWTENNCRADRKVGIDDAVLGFGVSDELAEMDTDCYLLKM